MTGLYRAAWVSVIAAAIFFVAAVGWQQVNGEDGDSARLADSTGSQGQDTASPGGNGSSDDEQPDTPTPTPSPTPIPVAIPQCKGKEGETPPPNPVVDAPADPTVASDGLTLQAESATASATAPAPPTPAARVVQPDSVFWGCQVIAYYGHPWDTRLGVLGRIENRDEMIAALKQEVAAFDESNGERNAIGAFHLIYAVAQADPQDDGSYLARMPDDVVQEWIALAEENDFIIYLDIQMGHSTIAAELPHVLKYLEHPRVHLALDPEWAMPPGVAPGEQIGSMDAAQINEATQTVQQLITEKGLENKMVMVHQFTESMITNKDMIVDEPDVDLIIDMDGWGDPSVKIEHYNEYVRDDGAEFAGFKLFYLLDTPMMTAPEVNALVPMPDYIMYQ